MKCKIGDIVQVMKTKRELFAENMYRGKADVHTIAKVVALSKEVGEIALNVDGSENDIDLFNLNSFWIKSSSVLPVETINIPQPDPIKNDHPSVWDLVMEDMKDRDQVGLTKYGTKLQPFNGRDALIDAYQEALDLVVYLRQAIYEQENIKFFDDFNEEFQKVVNEKYGTKIPEPLTIAEFEAEAERIESAKEWLDKPVSTDNPFCSCSGAVHMYEGSDGHFRCRACVKRIRKNN